MATHDARGDFELPLADASDSELNRLVDETLRTGKHVIQAPAPGAPPPERYHARAIAEQMQKLAQHISDTPPPDATDDRDEWWFEVDGRKFGPLSLHKIRFLWEEGELTPDSLCWHAGFPSWVSLFKVSELAEALSPKIHIDVEAAGEALRKGQSAEWNTPGASGLESVNRKRLEAARTPEARSEPLPLSTPVNLADERAATYTALSHDVAVDPPRAGVGHALLSGLLAGAIAAGTLVALRVWWPIEIPPPIVIGGPPTGPVQAPAVAPAPVAAPVAPMPPAADSPAVARPPVAEARKTPNVAEAFQKAAAAPLPEAVQTAEVFEVVLAHKADLEACAQAQHAAVPDSSGNVMMRWTLELDGRATGIAAADPELGKTPFAECVARAIAGWSFPKHAAAQPPVEMPFKY